MVDRTRWPRGKVLVCAFAVGSVMLHAGSGRAQAISNAYGGVEAIPYNVSFNTALRASDTYASVFGAASMAERIVFPALRQDEDWVVRFASNTVYGGVTVPVDYMTDAGNVGIGVHPVDFSAVSLCAGYRLGDLGLFYASSMTGTVLAPNTGGRVINGTIWALDLAATSVGGARVTEYSRRSGSYEDIDINGMNNQADFIVGAQYDLGFLQARAGYVGSSGVFTNVSQADIRAFLTSIIRTELGTIPYLRTGIENLPVDDLGLEGSMSSLFARKIRVVAPFEPEADVAYADLREASSFDRWTGHMHQLSIAKNFDVLAALGFHSGVSLQELRAGWHTEGFHRVVPTDPDEEARPEEGWGVQVGYVNVPDMYYYGLEGGAKVSLIIEGRAPAGRLKISRNDPDLLAVFPFAYDAWSLSWELGFDSAVDGPF